MAAAKVGIAGLTMALSAERLRKYRESGDDDTTALARYTWNQAIADSMSLSLHIFEVTLRNAIDASGVRAFGTPVAHGGVPSWLDAYPPLIKDAHAQTTAQAREELRDRGAPRTPGRLIAEMSLGFWVLLFGSYYDQAAGRRGRLGLQLWTPANLRAAFPNVKPHLRDREQLRKRFDAITKFRNRLAHHEPVFHMDPLERHREITAAIRWMNADAANYVESLDTLRALMTGGHAAFTGPCAAMLASD